MSRNPPQTGQRLWAALSTQPFPYLHGLTPVDRDRFVLLDAYLRACVEEWCASSGQLSTRSIALLDTCAQSITKRFRLLNGEGQYYFGQFRRLAQWILRGVDAEQVYRQAEQEMEAELDQEHDFGELLPDFAFPVETSTGND